MDLDRKERIKELWNKIHGDLVPIFYWQFHPNMEYWYDDETDCLKCDCGLVMPIDFKDDELNERNIRNLIWEMRNKIYADYKKMGWDIGSWKD